MQREKVVFLNLARESSMNRSFSFQKLSGIRLSSTDTPISFHFFYDAIGTFAVL